jgi:hypothetical protein
VNNTDKYLSKNPFKINEILCYQLAQQISNFRLENNQMLWRNLNQETQLVFKLSVIAICHQINWDFLQDRLAEKLLVYQNEDLINKIANISSREIQKWLNDYSRPERIRAQERARLLRDIGRTLQEKWRNKALTIYESCDGYIEGTNGFLKLLESFLAFSEDPLRKKSQLLIHELVKERIFTFNDLENISPAIDYHIIRLYLRSGKVMPLHRPILELLKGHPRPRARLVRLLRSTISDALRISAGYSGLTIPDVNYIEWQIGRNVCLNKNPLCISAKNSNTIASDVATLFTGYCPYESYCWAFTTDREWLDLQEPKYEKTFY